MLPNLQRFLLFLLPLALPVSAPPPHPCFCAVHTHTVLTDEAVKKAKSTPRMGCGLHAIRTDSKCSPPTLTLPRSVHSHCACSHSWNNRTCRHLQQQQQQRNRGLAIQAPRSHHRQQQRKLCIAPQTASGFCCWRWRCSRQARACSSWRCRCLSLRHSSSY